MSEWKEVRLGEIGTIITGKTPPKKYENVLSNNKLNNTMFITPTDMNSNLKYIESTERFVTNKGLEFVSSCKLPKESICVSCIGSDLGKVYKIKEEAITNQQINSIVVANNINSDYVYYYLLSIKHIFKRLAGGTATPILNKTNFSNIKISLPPLPIQKKISDILSVIDEKIETLQNINSALEEMAKAIFKSWFVDFDIVQAKANGKSDSEIAKEFGINEEIVKLFPSEFKTSEIGKIPKGWEVVYLKNEFKFERGVEPGSKWYIENPIKSEIQNKQLVPFYRVKDLDTKANIYIPFEVCKNKISKFGEILVSFDGTIGRVSAFLEGSYSSGIRKISAANYSNAFIYFLMQSDYIKDLIKKYATGTTILHAGKSINYLYLIKNDSIIKEYEKIIILVFNKILNNTQQIQTLQELRDTLLPKLINGEIKVDELDIKGFEWTI